MAQIISQVRVAGFSKDVHTGDGARHAPGIRFLGPVVNAMLAWSTQAKVPKGDGSEFTIDAGTLAAHWSDSATKVDYSSSRFVSFLDSAGKFWVVEQQHYDPIRTAQDVWPLHYIEYPVIIRFQMRDAKLDITQHCTFVAAGIFNSWDSRPSLLTDWVAISDRTPFEPTGTPPVEDPTKDALGINFIAQIPYPSVPWPGAYLQGPDDPTGLSANRVAARRGVVMMITRLGALMCQVVNDPLTMYAPQLPGAAAPTYPHVTGVIADDDAWWLLALYPGGPLQVLKSIVDLPRTGTDWTVMKTIAPSGGPIPPTYGVGCGGTVISFQGGKWHYITSDSSNLDVVLPDVWDDVLNTALPAPSSEGAVYATMRFEIGTPAPIYVKRLGTANGFGVDQFGIPLYVEGSVWDTAGGIPVTGEQPTLTDFKIVWCVCTDNSTGVYVIDETGNAYYRAGAHANAYTEVAADIVLVGPEHGTHYWKHTDGVGETVISARFGVYEGATVSDGTVTQLFSGMNFPSIWDNLLEGSAFALVRVTKEEQPAPAPVSDRIQWTGNVCTPSSVGTVVCLVKTNLGTDQVSVNTTIFPVGTNVLFRVFTNRDVGPTPWWVLAVDQNNKIYRASGSGGPDGPGPTLRLNQPGMLAMRGVLSQSSTAVTDPTLTSPPLILTWV